MPVAPATPTLVFPLAAWDGPSGVAYIQGMVRDPESGDYFITQADKITGQTEQNVVIRRHHRNLRFQDSQTVTKAGHVSSVGIERDGRSMIWLGHKAKGVGRFAYETGQQGFERMSALPDGDISVHRNVACVRNRNRFRGYRLSDAKAGRATLLFDFTIPAWGKRFQGHSVVAHTPDTGLVCVHRDIATNKESRAIAFTFEGSKVAELDTTKMGDEAEGFLIEEVDNDPLVWVVKRTGPNKRAKRFVVATLWLGELTLASTIAVDPTTTIKAIFTLLGSPSALTAAATIRAAKGGYVSRYTYYVQKWLIALTYYDAAADGRWGNVTQAAYDTFRRHIDPAWPEADCIGLPGITSLTLLRNAAVKAIGKDQLKVIG